MLSVKLLHVSGDKGVGVLLDIVFISYFLLSASAGGSSMSAFLLSLALRRAMDYALNLSAFDFMCFIAGADAFMVCSGLSRG